ncbi:MAG: ECF transporter S component [Oscillospiraceae bacterium]|nr:ECF transporter S component [Oscillospiraceae bacterium]
MKSKKIRQLVFASLCLAIGIIIPRFTGQAINEMISPMHIPVLICGFVCGWMYGGIIGFITPLISSFVFGMPPLYPIALSMAFELAAYGIVAGLMYKLLPKKIPYIYVTLVSAMLIGRGVLGLARTVLISNMPYSFEIFMTSAFVKAVPGIILHIAIIPFVIIGLKAAKLMAND